MYKIVVPATSANLASGFDCLGAALDTYNTIEVEEIGRGVKIEASSPMSQAYNNENNLIYKSMKYLFEQVGYTEKGVRIIQNDSIPPTRGLGSSAACIVAGLLGANMICGQKASIDELAYMAASLDGHPDNTTPAIFGGLRAAVLENNKVYHVEINVADNLKFVAFIPDFTLSTTKARMVLPQQVLHSDASFNLGRLALLVSSLNAGKFENLACAMDDKLHQPYRKKYIPDIDKIFEGCMSKGARGCYISGAGPTLMAMIDCDYSQFCEEMNEFIKSLKTGWSIKLLNISKKGAEVFLN